MKIDEPLLLEAGIVLAAASLLGAGVVLATGRVAGGVSRGRRHRAPVPERGSIGGERHRQIGVAAAR